MKRLLIYLALVTGLALAPTMAFAKDKRDDDWHKAEKNLRGDLNVLQAHYDQVKDRVKYNGGDRRQWDALHDIRRNIDDLLAQVDSGRFDFRDVHDRIQRDHDDLRRVQDQLEGKNQRRGGSGGFYRSN